jgi:glutathione S-transferase
MLDSGEVLTQSSAIVEYLEEIYPDPPLLPSGAIARAKAWAGAAIIGVPARIPPDSQTRRESTGPSSPSRKGPAVARQSKRR